MFWHLAHEHHLAHPAHLVQAIAAGMEGIRRVEQRHISVEQAKASKEVFLVGSSLPIMPVVQVRSIHAVFAVERGLAAACPACRWCECALGPTGWVFRCCCCRRGRDEGSSAWAPHPGRAWHTCQRPCHSHMLSFPTTCPPPRSGTPPPLATAAWALWRCRSAA